MRKTSPTGLVRGAFEYRQAEEIRDVFARHGVRYLFIGKSGAIILGYPDTTQDADIFPDRSSANGRALVGGLRELGFDLRDSEAAEIERGKDVEGFPVCHPDDIIASKVAANRAKDRESPDRLRSFRDYWLQKRWG